jgi:hypothetical protein
MKVTRGGMQARRGLQFGLLHSRRNAMDAIKPSGPEEATALEQAVFGRLREF